MKKRLKRHWRRLPRRCCSLPGLQVLRTQKMYGIAGVVYWTYSMATAQGVYSQHVLTYSLNDGTLKKAYGKWAPTYQKSYANAHGQPLKFYTANWRVYK